jgi:hypothetical protein
MKTTVLLERTAYAAAIAVVAMLLIFLLGGVGQDPLQSLHAPAEYTAILLKRPPLLRLTIAIDNVFIALYVTVFLTSAILMIERGAKRSLVIVSVALIGLTAFLDLAENLHFIVMLGRAERGLSPSEAEIALQVFASAIKFHASYVGLFVFGGALLGQSSAERWMARLNWFLQLPVGVAIFVSPPAIAFPLVFVRFTYFVTGLLLLARIYGAPPPERVGSSAPESLPSTTPSVGG